MKSEKIPFLGDHKVHRFVWENGLKLFVLQNKRAPVFSYQTWYNVGSRDEDKGKSGLAHFFEHMMFKGTAKNPLGHFDRAMESSGARDLNAFTSTDYTAYVASLPEESLSMVAALEADRMTGLLVSQDEFVSEREVVRNERKQRTENSPEGRMYEELQKIAFEKHPYGRPVIGIEADLDRMVPQDCLDFYHNFYAPNNAVICVVGSVKPEKVASTINKFYGKIPASSNERVNVVQEPVQSSERVSVLSLPVQVEKAYLGYKIPDAKHNDQVPLSVLATILSSGRSSRMYRELVDKGIVMDISASPHASKDPGLFYIGLTCQAGKRANEAIDAVDAIFARILKEGVTAEELDRAKNKLRTEIHMGFTTNTSVCHFLGQNESLLEDIRLAIRELDRIQEVRADEIVEVIKKYLNRSRRSVVIGKPE